MNVTWQQAYNAFMAGQPVFFEAEQDQYALAINVRNEPTYTVEFYLYGASLSLMAQSANGALSIAQCSMSGGSGEA